MSTMGSIYTSITSLSGYSRALNAISHNVANLNTPGFKASDLQFTDLRVSQFGRQASGGGSGRDVGVGVVVGEGQTRFSQGDIRQTGLVTHLAIDGNGFFVVRDTRGQVFLTRAGEFDFDANGRLHDPATGAMVQALDADGRLVTLDIEPLRTHPPQATATAQLTGNLSLGSQEHRIDDFEIIDAAGGTQTLKLTFTRVTGHFETRWSVRVEDAEGETLVEGEIRFTPGGSPIDGYNQLNFTVTSESGVESEVQLDFGEPGGIDGATSFSGGPTSTLRVSEVDGFPPGVLSQVVFNELGEAELTFSNGESKTGPRLAMASVRDPQRLIAVGERLFRVADGQELTLGLATESHFGRLVPGNLELSNTDLSREFAEIIILQRGFQAASQVLNVSNEMIEQVYNSLTR